jgi:hypothetical protein
LFHAIATALAANEPAGGAEITEIILATGGASIATVALLGLAAGHRSGRIGFLDWAGGLSARIAKLPAWCSLPLGVALVSLVTALFGMYWDISLHIDDGRDAGPLANPAHYFILVGLFGIFAAGVLAMAMPKAGERPGPAAVKITKDWYAPVGGILMAVCGGYSLIAFPLDDMWHRIFGQDVTLWGPTHLMLIGGAGMTLIAQAILLREGMQARKEAGESTGLPLIAKFRRVAIGGGLLIGASTFQAEFDFGVPQFSQVLHPVLIAFAAGLALVAARVWIGPGGALGAAAFFLVVRGIMGVIVGPGLGEAFPYMPLYLAEAACVELVVAALGRKQPLAVGAAAGLAIGTIGFAAEYAWTQVFMPLPWNEALLPEGVVFAVLAGISGGVLGALAGVALRGELPRPGIARPAFAGSLIVIAALMVNGLITDEPKNLRAEVTLEKRQGPDGEEALATVRLDPPSAADDSYWLTGISWQAEQKLVNDPLEKVGPGVYRSTEPLPIDGSAKALIRLHKDRAILAVPVRFPEDTAIPAPAIEPKPRFTREFADETVYLQRELKDDVPGWLWPAASLLVLFLSLGFVLSLGWGLARVSRAGGGAPPSRPERGARAAVPSPRPAGA